MHSPDVFLSAAHVFRKAFRYVMLVILFVKLPRNIIVSMIPQQWFLTFDNIAYGIGLGQAMRGVFVLFLVGILFEPLAVAALTHVSRQVFQGRAITPWGMMDVSLLRWNLLWFTAALHFVIVLVGISLFIIPGIYFSIIFVFHTMVVAEHGKWGIAALARSAWLVKGTFLRTLAILATVFIGLNIVGVLFAFVPLAEDPATNTIIQVVAATMRDVIATYFTLVIIAHFYRVVYEKEGTNVFTPTAKPE